jgi:hypothetical protein
VDSRGDKIIILQFPVLLFFFFFFCLDAKEAKNQGFIHFLTVICLNKPEQNKLALILCSQSFFSLIKFC